MGVVAAGDRVQILCASQTEGVWLESDADRLEPYWIRAQVPGDSMVRANEAVVGMRVGERRALTIDGPATASRAARTVVHELEVLAIDKGRRA